MAFFRFKLYGSYYKLFLQIEALTCFKTCGSYVSICFKKGGQEQKSRQSLLSTGTSNFNVFWAREKNLDFNYFEKNLDLNNLELLDLAENLNFKILPSTTWRKISTSTTLRIHLKLFEILEYLPQPYLWVSYYFLVKKLFTFCLIMQRPLNAIVVINLKTRSCFIWKSSLYAMGQVKLNS